MVLHSYQVPLPLDEGSCSYDQPRDLPIFLFPDWPLLLGSKSAFALIFQKARSFCLEVKQKHTQNGKKPTKCGTQSPGKNWAPSILIQWDEIFSYREGFGFPHFLSWHFQLPPTSGHLLCPKLLVFSLAKKVAPSLFGSLFSPTENRSRENATKNEKGLYGSDGNSALHSHFHLVYRFRLHLITCWEVTSIILRAGHICFY